MNLQLKIFVLHLIVTMVGMNCHGQSVDHPILKDPFPFNYFHHKQDYAYLQDTLVEKNLSDNLKRLQIGNSRLAIGGDFRIAAERFKNEAWSEFDGNLYLLQRVLLFADLRLNNDLRLYSDFGNGLQYFREGGSRPIDRGIAYIFQGFIEYNVLKTINSELVC